FTGCVALLLGVAATGASRAAAETPSGEIYVTTLPSGADVFVDGTYVGRSPALVGGLERGHHALTLTKSGWIVQEEDVTVRADSVAMSSTRLLPGSRADAGAALGSVAVRSAPAGASLMLDGNAIAPSSQPVTIAAGLHHIAMKTARGRTTRSLDVMPDTTTQVVLQEPKSDESRTSIIAPAEDYLPTDAFSLVGKKIVVRYGGHVVVGHLGDANVHVDGTAATFDAAPDFIAGRLYLPLALLEKLTGDTSK
ncbi:MAG: PEGA domain-containing protein, partial [Candidatus Eremiobacteraeota bacterium]|nr:PEGA domain-containing protein [Candidatus Eremiobacteraeota bacterium]